MLTVIHLGIIGEFGGFIVAHRLAQRRLELPLRPLLPSVVLTLATFALATIYALRSNGDAMTDGVNTALLGFVALVFALSFLGMRDLRSYIARRTLTRHEA